MLLNAAPKSGQMESFGVVFVLAMAAAALLCFLIAFRRRPANPEVGDKVAGFILARVFFLALASFCTIATVGLALNFAERLTR